MISIFLVYLISCLFYLVSGGRLSLVVICSVLLVFTLTLNKDQNKEKVKKTKLDELECPISPTKIKKIEENKEKRVSSSLVNVYQDSNQKIFQKKEKKKFKYEVKIFYFSLSGNSKRIAEKLHEKLGFLNSFTKTNLLRLSWDIFFSHFLSDSKREDETEIVYIFVVLSYEGDIEMTLFLNNIKEVVNSKESRKFNFYFAVFGLGNSNLWKQDNFCCHAKIIDQIMNELKGKRLLKTYLKCFNTNDNLSDEWINKICDSLHKKLITFTKKHTKLNGNGVSVVDIEDINLDPEQDNFIADSESDNTKEMVTTDSTIYKTLEKQGYSIVGSHSGVKICRWTKSALRGRGSCYKYTFYGIKSHLCMEATPSLACSNKCVFCWRHGSNPVAKLDWEWEVNEPEFILKGIIENHKKKIKQFKGIPGIDIERFKEASVIKHCALSLVGEPIFYPHINKLLDLLHKKGISTFLVCNAQHPQNLENLNKVTQLYVSIDATTKSSLKKIGRPMNKDFWERFLLCLDILSTKQSHQRTVFRLTLVKGFNMDEVNGYADLIERGNPSQIEVKGATYCGNTKENLITMQNIPFYDECRNFCLSLEKELKKRLLNYEIALEHAHSCCILISHTKFKLQNKWHTHINYDLFFKLLNSGAPFNDTDYISLTPEWALWNLNEAGFSPDDTRFIRKQKLDLNF